MLFKLNLTSTLLVIDDNIFIYTIYNFFIINIIQIIYYIIISINKINLYLNIRSLFLISKYKYIFNNIFKNVIKYIVIKEIPYLYNHILRLLNLIQPRHYSKLLLFPISLRILFLYFKLFINIQKVLLNLSFWFLIDFPLNDCFIFTPNTNQIHIILTKFKISYVKSVSF